MIGEPRILLVRLSSLGDILFALPALARLREGMPRARIEWVVEDRFAAVLEGHPLLDEVIVYPRRAWTAGISRPWLLPAALGALRRHFSGLRARNYDLVLDFQGNLKSALHRIAARGGRTIAFAAGHTREASHLVGAAERVAPPPGTVHRVDKFLSLLGPLGLATSRPAGTPPPAVDPPRVEAMRSALGDGAAPLVLLHPATSPWGRDKQWPPERFAGLARRLAEDAGARVLVTHGPGERGLAEGIVRDARGAASLAPATASLRDLAALLSLAQLFVGADTGALHLACALGRPAVGLYGATDPAVYGPIGRDAVVVRAAAAPASRERSRIAPAMLAIGVEEVVAACQPWLEGRARRRNAASKTSS